MSDSLRRCAGCGRSAAKSSLFRFVAPNGTLLHAPSGAGRGAYTCRRLQCFERALSRRAFNRALKAAVRVEPELSRLYTAADG